VPDEEGAAGYKAIGYHGNRYDSNRPLANDRLIGTNHNATMTQAIMYWGSLIALVGLIWLLAIDILLGLLGHGKPNRNKQQGRSLPEQRD
jgi:hypothetical protein